VAQWIFNASLYGCPLVWIVGGIMLLVGAIALLIVYWDDVCAWVKKYSNYLLMLLGPIGWVVAAFRNWDKISAFLDRLWGSFRKVCPNIADLIEKIVWIVRGAIGGAIDFIRGAFGGIYDFFLWIFGGIGRGVGAMWSGMIDSGRKVYEWIAGKLLPVFQVLGKLFGWIGDLGSMIGAAIAGLFGRIDGWIGRLLRLLGKIPGLEFLSPDVTAKEIRPAEVVPNVTAAGRKNDVSAGGIRGGVTNNRTNNFGGVTINTTRFPGPGELEDYVALQA